MNAESTFGPWLKGRRKALGLTQRELAQRIGCAVVTIQKIEEGERRPSQQIAELLAEHLEIPGQERPVFLRAARQGANPTTALDIVPEPAQPTRQPSTNLPTPLTPLLGRQAEMAALHTLLTRPDVRLVTLVGPPGVGKSRLSIAAAQVILDFRLWILEQPDAQQATKPKSEIHTPKFADGVWFVSLAAVSDPALVISTIAYTLGVTEGGASSIQMALQNYLSERTLLLVLDNFEQIIEAASDVAQLLMACPLVKVLVSSRVPLHVRGEYEVAVEPFVLPDPTEALPPPEELRRRPALALFEARVQAFRPSFQLNNENARTVVEICARLDGLALAIELAAARVRQFNLESLLAHLQRPAAGSLNLLTGGARDLPPRHQTLRNAILWSYRLLDAGAQQLFAQVGVFVGGFSYEALHAVAGPPRSPGGRPDHSLMPHLQAMLEQGLVQQQPGEHATRFTMLETIRSFALEQLAEQDEEPTYRRRHADYFLHLAGNRQGQDADQSWVDRLKQEQGNLRAALSLLLDQAPGQALHLANRLADFWYLQGYHAEGRQWLDGALAANPAPTALRAAALLALGKLAHEQSDYPAEQRCLDESLSIYRALNEPAGMAQVLQQTGWLVYDLHDVARAREIFHQSLALFRQLDEPLQTANVLIALAHIVSQQEAAPLEGDAYLEESLAIYRTLDHASGIANVLHRQGLRATQAGNYELGAARLREALAIHEQVSARRDIGWAAQALGETEWLQRDLALARRHLSTATQLFDEMGDTWGLALTQHHLAQIERVEGQLPQARQRYQQGLRLFQTLKNRHMIARCLAGLGGVALGEGNFQHAAHCLAAADAILTTLPPFLAPGDAADYEEMIAHLRQAMGDAEFATAWTIGGGLVVEQLIETES